MRLFLVILLSVLLPGHRAHALVEVPTLRFGIGHSMINFSAVDSHGISTLAPDDAPASLPLGSLLTLSPSFLWDVPQLRSRIGFHFLADIGSDYGFVSIIGLGLDMLFYPMGLSSSREVRDDGSTLVKTRVAPFVQFQVTPEKMSITGIAANPLSTSNTRPYFNILLVETSVGAGVDYPVSDNMILFAGLHLRFASFASEEATVGRLTYSGPALIVGVMTNFY